MNQQAEKVCSICNIHIYGDFCHQCGQKVSEKRLSIVSVIRDLASNLFSLEKSVFATIIHILRTPAKVVNNYWEGNRRYYESPSKLLVYASLIIGLHLVYHGNLILGMEFTDAPQAFFIVLLLFLCTCSSYLLYLKNKHTFLEVTVANLYLFCTLIIVVIFIFELFYLFVEDIEILGVSCFFTLLFSMTFYSSIIFSSKNGWGIRLFNAFLQLFILITIAVSLALIATQFGELKLTY